MDDQQMLYQILEREFGRKSIKRLPISAFVTQNLKQSFAIREYQEEALQYFMTYYNEQFEGKPDCNHLLFHMATGSGKTFIMAGLILYLYEQGYRNFLFFVNSTSIIDKTRDNFLNKQSLKYLFNQRIQKGEQSVSIREVENFQAKDNDDISIVFTTIQGLHSTLNNPKENGITFDDFEDKKTVLISDEAHHINAETKAKITQGLYGDILVEGNIPKEQKEEITSWENTVNKIFRTHKKNILLEFTATSDYENNQQIKEKYADKLIYDYPLKKFREDKYSKEVEVLQSDTEAFEQMLQAVLLSQYRRKIFEKNKILIKPVILFKSKTIAESNSLQKEFLGRMKTLTRQELLDIRTRTKEKILQKIFDYLEANNILLENFVREIQEDFSEAKLISVNSKEDSIEKQLAINSLEAPENEYRAIFAVDKLNEGWDVLNLFDIVRVYPKRDARNNIPGATTVKEAQLIGRGARYCPFKIHMDDDAFIRKFDDTPEHELRICETLYYHSTYNPKYIQELKSALIKSGIIADNNITREMILKSEFKQSDFYQKGVLYLNKLHKYSPKDTYGLPETVRKKTYKVSLKTGHTNSTLIFNSKIANTLQKIEKDFYLREFAKTIVKKALFKLPFYAFCNLIRFFPHLESIDEFISSDHYLKNIRVTISGLAKQIEDLSPDQILYTTTIVLKEISAYLESNKVEYEGSQTFYPHLVKETITNKYLTFSNSDGNNEERGKSMNNNSKDELKLNLASEPWYVFNDCYGTDEEKYFLKYIAKNYKQLKEKFEDVYLIRNEKHFKIYAHDGRATEPDFLLIVSRSNGKKKVYYQVFIEPKGQHLRATDSWKEALLLSLKNTHRLEQVWQDKEYHLLGMPFYTQSEEVYFDEEFKKTLGL